MKHFVTNNDDNKRVTRNLTSRHEEHEPISHFFRQMQGSCLIIPSQPRIP